MKLLMEYDRTKRDLKCAGCNRFYKLLDDAAADDIKNVVQLTPYKAIVDIKEEFLDEYNTANVISNKL